jgi:ribosomal protein L14|tara:strand:+ start:1052 stop:1288 length:237 start_codon:yes stop_codon:yes gene_type:complete
MIIYDEKDKSKKTNRETETVAFFDMDDASLTVTQSIFDGSEVLTHSSITLSTEEYNKIINIANAIYFKRFLNLYKLEE